MKEHNRQNPIKVLIVLYYWPPAGGPGVQRWLNFAKFLPENNIQPIIYCPSNPNYPIIDESLVHEVPDGIEVIKHPIKEPYRLARFFSKSTTKKISSGILPKENKQNLFQRIMLYVRGNFFIPDARINWVKPSVELLEKKIGELGIKHIITTGPPHSLHLIGLKLKAKQDITWIADFRDPWTTIGYHKKLKLSKSSANRHIQLEKHVLNSADHIVVTSFNTKKEFSQKTNVPITVVTNGYNPFKSNDAIEKSSEFSIAHIGSLLSERNPEALWKALAELCMENVEFKEMFKLQLYGVVSDDVINTLKEVGLFSHTKFHGYVSHQEALEAQREAQVLVLIEIDSEDTKAIIPGKLFEYMASKTPIIAVGPRESDVETLLYNSSAGNYFSYDQNDLIKTQLLIHFQDFQKGELKSSAINIDQYDRRELTKMLAQVVHKDYS